MKLKNFPLFLCIILFVFGCGKPEEQNTKYVKVGVILPLTGPIAMGGKRALDGINLAINEYNKTNNVKLNLIVEDSKAEPSEGIKAANKLINIDKVKCILGDLTSGVTLSIAPIVERNKVILIAPGASNPKVKFAGDYVFRNWSSDDFDGKVAAAYIINQQKKNKIAVIYILNEFGVGLKEAFVSEVIRLGKDIIFEGGFNQGQTDYRTLIQRLKGLKIDVIYIAGQPKEMGYFVKQLVELGVNITLFSNSSVEERDFQMITKKSHVEITYTTPYFNLSSTDSLTRIFVEKYHKTYNEMPDIVSAHGYDAACILINSLDRKSELINTDHLKKRLYSIKNLHTVTGNISFDEYGDVVKGIVVKKISPENKSPIVVGNYNPQLKM